MSMIQPGWLENPESRRGAELEDHDAPRDEKDSPITGGDDNTSGSERAEAEPGDRGTHSDLPVGSDPIERIREGMEVQGADGRKIGTVGEVHIGSAIATSTDVLEPQERSSFQVKRGILGLGGDIWLFAEDVREVSDDRITLRLMAAEAAEHGSARPPSSPAR